LQASSTPSRRTRTRHAGCRSSSRRRYEASAEGDRALGVTIAHFLSPVRRTGLDTISVIAEYATTEGRPDEQTWVRRRRQLSFVVYLRSMHVNGACSALGSGASA
jgi:hypothetical protein